MTTDLKSGDLARHPKHGPGVVYTSPTYPDQLRIMYRNVDEHSAFTGDLTGWERVETCTADERRILDDFREVASGEAQEAVYPGEGVVIASHADFEQRPELVKPGHVQVRVDDIDPQIFSDWSQGTAFNAEDEALIRIGLAFVARQVEQDATIADESPAMTGKTTDEQPTRTTTVTLPCPDCGEALPKREARVARGPFDGKWVAFEPDSEVHTCKLDEPDEPTEFGARVTVTPDLPVADERWCRRHDGYWTNADGELMAWAYLIKRGTVTLGWDE
ncbi:hypothetical protein [Dermacoccus nishinomiyaensis]|uniref:hypothetical protein n=1 Tax=Dermacoccus nishinomiyaensis TaxID=1274 RepID=UPI00248D5886|nr:hypothetical protein [Dermacoccus nishinomiyaensis]